MKRPAWRDEPEPDPNNPSKSQVKRDYLALQDLAMKLMHIPQVRLDAIEMDERLREAVDDLRKLKNQPARARQAQYVGKLLRDVELGPFHRALLP